MQQNLTDTQVLPAFWEPVGWKTGNLNIHSMNLSSMRVFHMKPALLTDASKARARVGYSLLRRDLQHSVEMLMQGRLLALQNDKRTWLSKYFSLLKLFTSSSVATFPVSSSQEFLFLLILDLPGVGAGGWGGSIMYIKLLHSFSRNQIRIPLLWSC